MASSSAEAASDEQSWLFESFRAMTLVPDETTTCLVPSFYMNWLGYEQTLDREPLDSLDHEACFTEFCNNIDARCINTVDGTYPEGVMIYPTQAYKDLGVLRAVESSLDFEGYIFKVMGRQPQDEIVRGEQWAEEDRDMDARVAWFRQHLTQRADFSLLGSWVPLSSQVISKCAHDYSRIKKRRKAKLELRAGDPDMVDKASTLFGEIFEASTLGPIRAQYQQRREHYLSGQGAGIDNQQFADFNPEIDFSRFEYSADEERLQYCPVDGYPVHLRRLTGADMWNKMQMLNWDEKAKVVKENTLRSMYSIWLTRTPQIVQEHFGRKAVWAASKLFRVKRDDNQACQIWHDMDNPAQICTECWHWFDKNALISHFKARNLATCPTCRAVLTIAPFPIAAIAPAPRKRHRQNENKEQGLRPKED